MMKKRLLSMALAAVMVICCTLTPMLAFAKSSTPVWDKYSKLGSHKVSTFTFKVSGNDFTYKVWYPSDIKKMKKTPVVLYCNGTSSNYIKTPEVVKFMKKTASHGFVCLTNTDENTGMGESMNAGLNALIRSNGNKKSIFYKKLNVNNVGISGHSQGASCCINLASKGNFENRTRFKAIYACSLPTVELEKSPFQNCPYDASLVNIPTLMISGTGATDNAFVSPLKTSMRPAFAKIQSEVVMARIKDVEHPETFMKSYPYMIAWFQYKLRGNKTAKKAFVGKSPEIKRNKKMRDYKRKIYCKPTAITALTGASGAFKVQWKAVSKAEGYEIQYSTNKKFPSKSKKSVKVSKKVTAKTVKNLKSGATYYVRVRTYRTSYGAKSYSAWSKTQAVNTK